MDKLKIGVGVGVMILREGKVLLGRRSENPNTADSELHGEGTWTMPGGKVDFGESFEDAAVRELEEETGIMAKKEDTKVISVANDRVSDAHFVTIGLLCENSSGEPEVREPDEITEWCWFSLDNLPSPIFFCSERVLARYRDGKFYSTGE
ncbi:MAG: NUDIX domain-containing protein [Patescibacteria group bacterium]|nr:NUDIX domain-containing protein [Patescibacteria group bacterium]